MRLERSPAFGLVIARNRPEPSPGESPFDGRAFWDGQLSDPETFGSWWNLARKVSLRQFGNVQDAEDIAADTIGRVLDSADSFRGGNQKSWFLRVLTNVGYDELRKRWRRPSTSLDQLTEESGDAFDVLASDESPDRAARRAVVKSLFEESARVLPEDQRRVAELSYKKDLSYENVAEELQIPLGTVKSRLSRSREKLKRNFTAQGIDFDFLDN